MYSNNYSHFSLPIEGAVIILIIIFFCINTLSWASSLRTNSSIKMTSMLRLYRSSGRRGAALLSGSGKQTSAAGTISRLMGTQSGDDAKPPTALARLHLEDGSTLTGRSFGSHESVSGEVKFCVLHCAIRMPFTSSASCLHCFFVCFIHLSCKYIDRQVVFTTGMVGYPEALTDPSYQGQVRSRLYQLYSSVY